MWCFCRANNPEARIRATKVDPDKILGNNSNGRAARRRGMSDYLGISEGDMQIRGSSASVDVNRDVYVLSGMFVAVDI